MASSTAGGKRPPGEGSGGGAAVLARSGAWPARLDERRQQRPARRGGASPGFARPSHRPAPVGARERQRLRGRAPMTAETLAASPLPSARRRLDLSGAVMALFAAILALLIILPLAWLVVFAFSDRARNPTLGNFQLLFTDKAFLDPLLTTFTHRPLGQPDLLRRRRSHGLAGGAHRHAPGGVPIRIARRWPPSSRRPSSAPSPGSCSLRLTAVSSTSSIAAWSAPPADARLFDIYSLTGLIFVISCYTFPYVFVLVANALDRTPGDLEDASAMLRRHRPGARRGASPFPLAHAGAVGRRAGGLPAGHDAVRLAGDPGLPAGFTP